MPDRVRAIRGAITVEDNQPQMILEATSELLKKLVGLNGIAVDDLISVLFSMTKDLDGVFPAKAARQMGWNRVPLMCCQEIDVQESLPMCIRVMIHFYTSRSTQELKPVYLREAAKLREDLQ